ncbi:unnamed protein product [Symbiodinium microadriaticum]|nr:unnamed protein product [Symbiodinium sp. KB8]CAE7893055.1 unnamed protein product [Symbiodinium microadriaticum]
MQRGSGAAPTSKSGAPSTSARTSTATSRTASSTSKTTTSSLTISQPHRPPRLPMCPEYQPLALRQLGVGLVKHEEGMVLRERAERLPFNHDIHIHRNLPYILKHPDIRNNDEYDLFLFDDHLTDQHSYKFDHHELEQQVL